MKRNTLISMCMIVLLVLLPSIAGAYHLVWTLDDDHSRADGYRVYYDDGTTEYTHNFATEEATIDEAAGVVRWGPFEDTLEMHYGTAYTITLTRYNDAGESPRSESVVWTRPAYSPPTGQHPDPVISTPSGANGLGVE